MIAAVAFTCLAADFVYIKHTHCGTTDLAGSVTHNGASSV